MGPRIKQWVHAVVAWAQPEGRLSVQNPMVAIWRLDLVHRLRGLAVPAGDRFGISRAGWP